MSETTDVAATEPSAPPHDAPAPSGGRRTWVLVLPWVLAVVGITAAVWSTLQWQALAADAEVVESARTSAIGFVEDLTNWDASDGLDDEVAVLREQGTGPFLDEIDFVFGGDDLTGQLEDAGISASGELQEAYVQSVEDGMAEVFTVVEVTYTSPDLRQAPDPVTFPATLTLERSDDGSWLIREVTVPNSSQIGSLMGTPGSPDDGQE